MIVLWLVRDPNNVVRVFGSQPDAALLNGKAEQKVQVSSGLDADALTRSLGTAIATLKSPTGLEAYVKAEIVSP